MDVKKIQDAISAHQVVGDGLSKLLQRQTDADSANADVAAGIDKVTTDHNTATAAISELVKG